MQVSLPAGCRLKYLQLAGEVTQGVIADCLRLQVILFFLCVQLPVFLSAIVRVFLLAFAVLVAGVFRVFLPGILVLLPAKCMLFWQQKQAVCKPISGTFTYILHVKLPEKYPLYSGNFSCHASNSRAFCARSLPRRSRWSYLFLQANFRYRT